MVTINGFREIVFNKSRITYRNDDKDINVYVSRNDLNEYHNKDLYEVSYSLKDDKEHTIAENLNLVNAKKKAIAWLKSR